jgi:hypothetical protein
MPVVGEAVCLRLLPAPLAMFSKVAAVVPMPVVYVAAASLELFVMLLFSCCAKTSISFAAA